MRRLRLLPLAFILSVSLYTACTKDVYVESTDPRSKNLKGAGESARDFLTDSASSSIKIQLQYMPGYQPDAAAINNLINFINLFCHKPDGVQISETQIAASGKDTLTLNEVADIEGKNRTEYNSGKVLSLYVLYLDASYDQPNVLGVAFRNTSLCIFGRTINKVSGSLGQVSRTKLESLSLEHEFGHLMGLVDNGTSMVINHLDAAHGKHCNNKDCLMYYVSETNSMIGSLMNGEVPTLDANCMNDLKANGSK